MNTAPACEWKGDVTGAVISGTGASAGCVAEFWRWDGNEGAAGGEGLPPKATPRADVTPVATKPLGLPPTVFATLPGAVKSRCPPPALGLREADADFQR